MLQSMRQNTKVILWIVIMAFVGLIFAVWGMDLKGSGPGAQSGVVGKVNGAEISAESFDAAYRQEVENYRGQTDLPVMKSVVRTLEDQAWKRLVNQVIIDKAVDSENIVISDEEVVFNIRTNPPDFILYHERYQTDGRFDYQAYLRDVNDVSMDWRGLEAYFRGSLPLSHLQTRVSTEARITEGELKDLYRQRSETVDFSYVAFLPSEFADRSVEVSEDEVRSYYDGHVEQFTAEEEAVLEFTTVSIEVTEADREAIRARMRDVLAKLAEGNSFEDLARFFSQGQTAEQAGDLGTFQRGTMRPDMEEAAFALEEEGVTEIIESDDDVQILQCAERSGEGDDLSIRLRQILLRVEPGPATIEKIREETEDLQTRAGEANLADAARETDHPLLGTGPFARGTYVPGVGDLPPANVFAFSADVGDISDPILHNDRYYIFSLVSRDSSRTKPFDDVSTVANLGAQRLKRLEIAGGEAEKYSAALEGGASLEEIARSSSREVESVISMSRLSSVPGIGEDMSLVLAAFSSADSVVAGPVHTDLGVFFLRRDRLNQFDEQQYALERPSLIRSLLTTRQDFFFQSWLDRERAEADVEDLRPELAARIERAKQNSKQRPGNERSSGPLGF